MMANYNQCLLKFSSLTRNQNRLGHAPSNIWHLILGGSIIPLELLSVLKLPPLQNAPHFIDVPPLFAHHLNLLLGILEVIHDLIQKEPNYSGWKFGLSDFQHLHFPVFKDVLNGLCEELGTVFLKPVLLHLALEFSHPLKVHGLTAHGAVGFIALLVPRLGTVLTESMPADELAVGSSTVADGALHVD